MNGYSLLFLKGVIITLSSWIVSGLLSIAIGTTLGILSCRQLGSRKISNLIKFYTFIAKGVPAYVQILIAYFIVPNLFKINISAFSSGCIALAFCSSGYVTEIIRSGINSISISQWDACKVLGYPLSLTLKNIILPQTVKNILPALIGELEQLLKSTSLLATIGVTEITRTGINIISRELNPVPMYLTIAILYLLFSAILNLVDIITEKRLAYGQS